MLQELAFSYDDVQIECNGRVCTCLKIFVLTSGEVCWSSVVVIKVKAMQLHTIPWDAK